MKSLLTNIASLVIFFTLPGCIEEKPPIVGYGAYNHTDEHIVSIVVNGEGGILDAMAHTGGGGVCCVVLPRKWKPGMQAKIQWQMDGKLVRSDMGEYIIDNERKKFIPGLWKEAVVDIPKYSEKDLDQMDIHFFDDRVELHVSAVRMGHPEYPEHLNMARSN